MSQAWPSRNKSAPLTISDGVLQALSVPPAVGRWLSQADQIPRGPETVMLSYGYWQRRFGGDRSVIGRNITVDSRPREIVGVMPQGSGSSMRIST